MRQIDWVHPAKDFVDRLVHRSVRADPLVAARHATFIAAQLALGIGAAAVFPAYLAMRGGLSLAEVVAFALLTAPTLVALYLSRTGKFDMAQMFASLVLSALVGLVASRTGGTASFAIAWAAVVPVEAAVSGSRRAVGVAAILAITTVTLVGIASVTGLVPVGAGLVSPWIHMAGLVGATVYGGALALAAVRLQGLGQELTRSGEERYALLAESSTDLVTRHGPNGEVLFASPGASALLHVGPEALAGQGVFERVHVADRPIYLSTLSRASRLGEPGTAEFRLRVDSDGPTRHLWVEMRCRPLGDAPVREVAAVFRDISDRKAHVLEVEAARQAAEAANAAKGRFLATVSHELRTPLNAVIGFSEMLMNEAAFRLDGERRQEYAALIHDSGHHLLSVVNGILDMSKIEAGSFSLVAEPFAVNDLIVACRNMLQLKAEAAGVELVAAIEPNLPDIVADKRACRQIYLNLMSNALKFTPRGGRVTVGATTKGSSVTLYVSDTGVGIGSDDLPRLGEPFFQASSSYDRAAEGTGLGLSVVKGLAELHGGDMEIESRLGAGTTVAVRLPVDCEEATATAPTDLVERLAARAGRPGAAPRVQKEKKRA